LFPVPDLRDNDISITQVYNDVDLHVRLDYCPDHDGDYSSSIVTVGSRRIVTMVGDRAESRPIYNNHRVSGNNSAGPRSIIDTWYHGRGVTLNPKSHLNRDTIMYNTHAGREYYYEPLWHQRAPCS